MGIQGMGVAMIMTMVTMRMIVHARFGSELEGSVLT